jgi:ribosomal protein S18 acetylase RimI-like enzyme
MKEVKPMKIQYIHTDQAAIELVEPLWTKLRDLHASKSIHFSKQIKNSTFHERSSNLIKKAEHGKLKIILAATESTNEYIGYCISTITKDNQGEMDSIYILENFRNSGIGDSLMSQSLEWFKEHHIENITIAVLFENEMVLPFYEKYGFFPRTYVLKN